MLLLLLIIKEFKRTDDHRDVTDSDSAMSPPTTSQQTSR